MLYFAYGSNLLDSRIHQLDRAPGAVRIDRASLRGYDLRFHKRGADGSGKCDCFESGDGSHVVHGALFAIPEGQRADLDRAEGLEHGYSRRELEVGYRSQSGTTTAWLYCAQSTHIDDALEPFRWYRDLVVAGARSSGFPEEYIRAIAAVEVQEDPDHARAQRMQRLLSSGPSGAPSSRGESAQPTTEPAPVCGRLGGEHLAAGNDSYHFRRLATMPDSRTQRGPHPKDLRSFTPETLPVLRRAVDELSWLLSRNYSAKASLKLVGDRYLLRDRQRKAIQRCAAGEDACRRRLANRVEPAKIRGQKILIDGYNALLTVEAAMSGGVVLATRDGVFRDLAALSRHYRQVGTTEPALEAIGSFLEEHGCGPAHWLLDRPISNSGRLARVIEGVAEERGWQWSVELVPNPDHPLQRTEEIVATADSAILDRCRHWLNLARLAVEQRVPEAWVVDLSTSDSSRVELTAPGPRLRD